MPTFIAKDIILGEHEIMLPKAITLDGPAASGKSTIGRLLASKIGYAFIDTGILYRIIAYNVLSNDISPDNEEGVVNLTESLEINIIGTSNSYLPEIFVNGKLINKDHLYTPEIDRNVPIVSRYKNVRERIRRLQRKFASNGKIVMSGRDIGTVVLPNAELKIYLHVSVEERARRRYIDRANIDETLTINKILEGLRRRDLLDETREISPMKPAEDAFIIHGDHFSPNEIVETIMRHFWSSIEDKRERS